MWQASWGLAEQVMKAAEAASEQLLGEQLPSRERFENIVVVGMGGSGIAGDVLVAAASPYLSVPVVVVNSYELPAFVSRDSLVFAVSFSGDTEETLEAAGQAVAVGAVVVAVSSGGELEALAREHSLLHFPVASDIPAPRAAIGAMATPPLVVLQAMGLFPGATRWIELAVEQLRERREELVNPGGLADSVAERIGRAIPIVESSHPVGLAAAKRWKTQVNENAKRPAFFSAYPELCHNEIVAWGPHDELTKGLVLVNLRHDMEHPQVSRRFELVRELAMAHVADVVEVAAKGEGELAQLLDLVTIGDFVSLHLARRDSLDPGPVSVLERLKQRLRQGA